MISRLQCTKYLQIYGPLKVFVNFSQRIDLQGKVAIIKSL